MDSLVVTALKQEKRLLKEILYFAARELEMLEFGQTQNVEKSLLLRAEWMGRFAAVEANVYEKMSDILNDPSLSAAETSEVQDLNLEIIKLAGCIVAIDEWTSQLAAAEDSCIVPSENLTEGFRNPS
jgi:hypothetical protein